MQNIIIIGNGISGITCARHIRKKTTDRITVISSETEHFFSRTALMYIYMGHMKYEHTKPYEDFFWKKNNIDLIQKRVTKIYDTEQTLALEDGQNLSYDKLVLATGSITAKYNWPGQDLPGVHGLYSIQDLQNIEAATKDIKTAIIVGGGLIGVELAEMLHTRHITTSIFLKDNYYWGSVLPEQDARLIEEQLKKYGVSIFRNTELKEIKGTANSVSSVITKEGKEHPAQFVGITTGVTPNISFLRESNIQTDKGVLVNEFFETNCPNVYAIGDCAQFQIPLIGRKSLEQVWYTGKMHGETLAETIAGHKTAYQPGPWYNSAKFFDLEYQTYGLVSAKTEEGNAYYFWKHPLKDVALGIYYRKSDHLFIGINAYGIRLRHAYFDKCLKENRPVEVVLSHLRQAWFNPEFSTNYIKDFLGAWNNATGIHIMDQHKILSAI